MRTLYLCCLACTEALVSLPVPTRRLLPLRRAEEEQVDPNVREIVSAAMYGTPAEVAAKAVVAAYGKCAVPCARSTVPPSPSSATAPPRALFVSAG